MIINKLYIVTFTCKSASVIYVKCIVIKQFYFLKVLVTVIFHAISKRLYN